MLIEMAAKTITLKALIEKEKNKIIYVESEGDFVDALFSFLTMPLGKIISLTRNHPPIFELGCINNLYSSVENLDARYLRTEACRTMLLDPQNAAAEHCENLKVKIDEADSKSYFLCNDSSCKNKLLSHCQGAFCSCGRRMSRRSLFYEPSDAIDSQLGFVSKAAQFIISDDMEVQPTSSVFLVSLLAKNGVQDFSSLEERTFQIGADEVSNLLKFYWVSRTPLTDVLLQKSTTREVMDLDRRVKRGLEPFAQGEEHLSLQRLSALEERLTNLHLRLESLIEDVDDTLALVKQETDKKGKKVGDKNESGSKSKNGIVVGPWGGNGGESWDDGIHSGVRVITLVYGGCIDSFTVVYDKNGKPAPPVKHGGAGGTKAAEVKLQYPEEFLTSVTGHYCPFGHVGSPVIRSLMFKSNKRTFGAFGVEEGTPFTLSMEGGSIVGFEGRSGRYLDAIGFHL